MQIIGITGGIGSGKTTVAKIFSLLGIPVYSADDAAKEIMVKDPLLVTQIREHFGDAAYFDDGSLNRKHISNIVFADKEQLELLNSLVHPATIRDSEAWARQQSSPYVLKEAALMYETESFHHVDKVIVVSAPQALRIQRVMKRDGVDRNAVLARMHKQLDEAIKLKLADYIIYNDEQQMVIPQVLSLHRQLLTFSSQSDGRF
ncbi:dephospho-CoA kinase [Chitinophaga sp. GCM10012297]|uniref:Dephospho-CoA kinase n=1 Tax=Chitinophaga chungangae TaxID=2821488 RepID=A0ABS3Y9S1_9BACT|nr:dephospho-CoA kinase [Chitinophaga chungangae]MBO9151424.1 dephospho-CoA kinase [Chitinophaga chungangae]